MSVLKGSTKSQVSKTHAKAPRGRQGPTPQKRSRGLKRGGIRR